MFCALAAGGAAITAAGHLVAEHYLTHQADRQLRSYTRMLTGRPLALFPGSRLAPGASGLGTADRELDIALRASGGQLLISAGVTSPPVAGRGWLEVSEPVSYRTDHIPFVYGAEDSSYSVTAKAGTGLPGMLVIGLNLAGVGQAVDRVTITCLAVSGVLLLPAALAAAWLTGVLLLPLARTAHTATAVGAGDLSHRIPADRARDDVGRLVRSLNQVLSEAEDAHSTAAAMAARTRASDERMRRAAADVGGRLRRPLMVVAGLAEAYRMGGRPGGAGLDRAMKRVADEAARMDAVLDTLQDQHCGGYGGASD